MEKLEFKKEIKAPAQKVWDILWNEDTYSQWTAPFNPNGGSIIQTDWKIGGKTYFLDAASKGGMVSTIKSMNEPHEIIFEHLGEIADGKEDTSSEKVKSWSGSQEGYSLSEKNGITTLNVFVETADEWQEMLGKAFPKALNLVKDMAEKS